MTEAVTGRAREWAPPPLHPYAPMIINVALTGAVPSKRDSPSLPVSPEEIAEDAIACAEAGASIVHIHVRDAEGHSVHDASLYEETIARIRKAEPQLIVCVTTSGRVGSDPAARATALRLDPSLQPDMASLTLGSFNFPMAVSHNSPDVMVGLLTEMKERGIKPELEVFEAGMVNTANYLMERDLIGPSPYFNVLLGSMDSAPAFVGTLAHIVDRLPQGCEWAAAGIGMFQRQMVVAGAVMGGNVRTGLEDSPRPVDGREQTNLQAVTHAVAAARLVGRSIETPEGARRRLGLEPRN